MTVCSDTGEAEDDFFCQRMVQNYIDDYIDSKNFSDFEKMMNSMINNGKIDDYLQGLIEENADTIKKSDDVIVQKCNNINILSISSVPDGFTVNITEYDVKKILWDYVYIKTVRNKTNHAITGRIIPDRVKFYYKDCGYNTENTTIDGLSINIRNLISRLKNIKSHN